MGKSHFSGAIIDTEVEIVIADGAVSIIEALSTLDGTGEELALTLADGEEGQRKLLLCIDATNDSIVTPANFANGASLTFDAAGEVADLVFANGTWNIIVNTATLA